MNNQGLAPEGSHRDDPAVVAHIVDERRIGPYALNDEEHSLLVELLDQPVQGFGGRYAMRLSDLQVMEVPLGQGQMQRWYAADDPASQRAIDKLMDLVGDAIDEHY